MAAESADGIYSSLSNFLFEQPPPGLVWLIIAVSSFHALVTFGSFVSTFVRDRRQKKKSIEDEFWFRKVIVPSCIEPMAVFVDCCADRLNELNDDCCKSGDIKRSFQAFQTWLLRERNLLLRKFRLVRLVEEDLYDQIAEIFDLFEDNLNNSVAKTLLAEDGDGFDVNESEGFLLDCELEVLSILRQSHHKI